MQASTSATANGEASRRHITMMFLQQDQALSSRRIAASFAADPSVRIPEVFWKTTGRRVLTLERLRGIKIDDLAALDAAGIDRAALAARASGILMKMIFEDGFFHADPHPGNFFVEPDGRIGLIDFGMTGTIDDRTRAQHRRAACARR